MSWNIGKELTAEQMARAGESTNPELIDISDLHKPVLSPLQQEAMAMAAANPVPMQEEAILGMAAQNTGLDDFGDPGFRKNLQMWLTSTEADTGLTPLGRAGIFMAMVRNAEVRLRVEDLVKRFPEILDIEIKAPLIIAGLPRSGTTYLQNFLASDPRLRSLPYWEALQPVPAPDQVVVPGAADPRREQCAQNWAQQDALLPYLKAIHPFSPDHIHEDIDFQTPEFGSYHLEWLSHAPVWRDYYLQMDQLPVYNYIKKCLQVLSFQTGIKRWLLKCPQHMEQLPTLKQVFPDATLVINHRDPVASIQSAIYGPAYSGRVTRSHIDTREISDYWIDRYQRLLQACVRDRATFDDNSSIDIFFHQLMEDPLSQVQGIYNKAGLRYDSGIEAMMAEALNHHTRGEHGRIQYHLQRDFDLNAADIRQQFDFYFDRFAVQAEVK
jgi:Sulfotransferase family